MSDTHLLQMALGLTPPWTVTGADFDPNARRLDIHIDFPSGSRFACPQCGATGCPAHDTAPMTPAFAGAGSGAILISSSTKPT